MTKESKFLKFERLENPLLGPEDNVYLCKNKKTGAVLAKIFYYEKWNQLVVSFNARAVFSKDCLLDIISYIKEFER